MLFHKENSNLIYHLFSCNLLSKVCSFDVQNNVINKTVNKMKRRILLAIVLLFALMSVYAQKAPIIGVSSVANESSTSAPLTYINSIKRAGGVPLVIPMTSDTVELARILEVIDGLVMTGGEDIDPLKWFNEEPVRALGKIAPERDEFDITLIRMAVEKGLPVLAICRGEQALNVAFGGTLYQDIPSQVDGTFVKHSQNAPSTYGTHTIDIDKNAKLYTMLGSESVAVNSYHHQAVKDVAKGFKITARAKDGVVEAIEKEGDQFVVGVQFHPEGMVSRGDDTFLPLFEAFIKASEANTWKP